MLFGLVRLYPFIELLLRLDRPAASKALRFAGIGGRAAGHRAVAGRSTERYKRLLRLSYLSPTIIDAIIASRQPPQLTNRFLQNLDGLPVSWVEQERLLLG